MKKNRRRDNFFCFSIVVVLSFSYRPARARQQKPTRGRLRERNLAKMKAKFKPVIDGKTLYSWGWSCARAAAAIGLTSSHLGYCLRGEHRFTAEVVRKLSALPKGKTRNRPLHGLYEGTPTRQGNLTGRRRYGLDAEIFLSLRQEDFYFVLFMG